MQTMNAHQERSVSDSGFNFTFDEIPTQDAEHALNFCQALAQLLSEPSIQPVPGLAPRQVHPFISIVTPVYNEEENIFVLHKRLVDVLSEKYPSYEIIFVNDGSKDHSLELLNQLAVTDPKVIVVDLARNFGHQVAISAGLDFARGQGVIIMDADLQDPPEVLPAFIEKWQEGYDVVYAIRAKRKENWFKRIAYTFFYRVLQQVADIDIPLDAGDFCIMDRRVVDILIKMPERNRFVRGIRSWIGLEQVGLAYERSARNAGKPKFTFNRLLYLALDGLVSFSYLPLRAITILGFIVSLFSILIAIFYFLQRITIGLSPPGFATIVVAVFFLAGIQLTTLGVIGEYVGRIFEEVKHRPLYVVRQVIGAGR